MLPQKGSDVVSAEVLQLERAADAAHRRRIELAGEPPFQLGKLRVAPALREIASADGTRETLEPRVMQVLVALARAEGATVSRDELIRTCWNGTVVGEDAINRTISLLRRLAEGVGRGAFRIETIPRVGYRLVPTETEAAPPAPADGNPSVRPRAGRSRPLRWAALGTVLAATVAAFTLWRAAPEGPTYSVTAEPFHTSGAATGFNDELLSRLTTLDVPTVAGRVSLALAGTAAEADGVIRVNAHLIDLGSNKVVWSGAITRPSAHPGGVDSAAVIVGYVAQCTLAGANDAGGTIPLEVLSRYARTCELGFRGQSEQGVRVARELTREAPDFAAGWFALGHHASALYRNQPEQFPQLGAEAVAAAEKLIELRPAAQEGYVLKAAALEWGSALERERLLRRAAKLDAFFADVGRIYLGDFLLQTGRFEEAFQLFRALDLQKSDNGINHARIFLAAAATGRWPVVDQALEGVRQLDPAPMPNLLWRKATWLGNWAEAERLAPLELPAQEEASIATYRAMASGDPGRKEAAARMVLALPEDCCVHLRIDLLTQLGLRAQAIALLNDFEAARTPGRRPGTVGLLFLADPALRSLWYDPAIEPFFLRNGWIDYWRASKTEPDLCSQERPPSFCRLLQT
jgi:DNA-binding winged helix-turn-helix (wHTH) protein/tetratricopeptide (TPR) repeat protein